MLVNRNNIIHQLMLSILSVGSCIIISERKGITVMQKTDTFELRLIPRTVEAWEEDDPPVSFIGVDYYINGVPLLDIIREAELPYCEQEDCLELACNYELNPKEVMRRQFARALEPPRYECADVIELYCCADCGICDCWSVCCKFQEDGDHILMKDFYHNHRDWVYPFEFRFRRGNYFSEIKKLGAENVCAEF